MKREKRKLKRAEGQKERGRKLLYLKKITNRKDEQSVN
jgi:hypothetical protein